MREILFYLQPHTIRGNPLAFEWIFARYLELASGLSKSGLRSVFLVDDEIKRKHSSAALPIYSPADFGIRFGVEKWPAFWREILTEPFMKDKNDLLEALFQKHPFDFVFCWNFDATLDRFCREKKSTVLYQELGMIRRPMLFQIDFEGLLWRSSLQRLYRALKDRIAVDRPRLENVLREMRSRPRFQREEILKRLSLDPKKPIVLIPLQVEDDSNIVVGSPFRSMSEFVAFCLDRIRDLCDYNVVIKRHPNQPRVSFSMYGPVKDRRLQVRNVLDEIDNLSLIHAADHIITINSSAGFEGLCFGRKVLTLGRSPYSGAGFSLALETGGSYALRDFEEFFSDLRSKRGDELDSFLSFALFHYHVPESTMFRPEFYLDMFRVLRETQDRELVFLKGHAW